VKYQCTVLFFISILGCTASRAEIDQDKQSDILALALPVSAYVLTLSNQDREGRWALTKSLALTAISTVVLNAAIDKDSPNGNSHSAFPSGHASVAFSSAAFLQRRYGWRAGMPAYLAASYVGWLRIDTDNHDYVDVIGGAAVGIASSYLLTKRFDDNVQAAAWSDGESAWLRVQLRW
jgi:membrane-associated phospholipid phosphatase